MRSRFRFTVIAFAVLALAAPAFLLADGSQLGTISGRVLDEQGGGIPGVTVELVATDKGFRRSQTTDSTGSFTFALLQPGPYTLRASLSGFSTIEKTNNIAAADKVTNADVTMRLAATAEEVTVTGEIPMVDKTNTSATTTVSSTLTQKLAITRNYQTLISNAPGVTGGANPNSHGSLASTNQYLFDGVDTTDVTTGTFGQNFNFEAIEEVVVSTAGISAEYGRAQGAIVNVITKSGTNTFSGSAKGIVNNDEWDADNKGANHLTNPPTAWNRTKFDENVWRYALTLGGPMWKDHAWFFGAYEWADVPTPFSSTFSSPDKNWPGESYQQVTDVKLWDAKLTFQVTPSHLFTAGANSDPINGFVVDYWGGSGEREALTQQNQNDCGGLCTWNARWSGVFGSMFSMEALYAEQDGDIFVVPFEGNGSPYFSLSDELFYNGATFDGFVKRPRKQANLAANLYTQLFGDSHSFKVGGDYQDLESVASFLYPNNEIFIVSDFNPGPTNRGPVLSPGDVWQDFLDPAPSVSTGKVYGIYALDKFEVGKHLFFNLGGRVDIQNADSDIGNTVIDTTTFSPRLTGVYDVFGNGKTLVSTAYGRYYQFLVQAIADSVYAGVAQQANYDQYEWDGSTWVFAGQVVASGNTQPVNEDLEPSYLDEINVAVQQQLGNTMAVGVRGIYRKWNDLVDDRRVRNAAGTIIRVPENFDDDQLSQYYKGIEVTFDKRFSRNWQAAMNYTLSRAEGDIGGTGTAANFTTQRFDYADRTCTVAGVGNLPCSQALNQNQYGYLPYDRTHIFKAFTAYTLPLSWVAITAAPSFIWQSGFPYQPQRAATTAGIGTVGNYFFDKRGSSRLPNHYRLDFALETVFKPWGPLELGVKGEVFNLTNQQPQTSVVSIRLIPDANFGAPTARGAFQGPRNYRLTALLRF
ncbi:MAG TPA: TonB-dependent receptor [Thermoanaerobaculia bacterium]|nr:TonB-dependent receptor [Thermoanaerobaculia bacterium]